MNEQKLVIESVVGTFLQQDDHNKEIYKDKTYETMDNTYENLTIEKPKAQTVWEDKNDLWTRTIWSNPQNDVTKQLGNLQLKKIPIYGHTTQVPAKSKEWNKTSTPETAKGLAHDAHRLTSNNKQPMMARDLAFTHLLKQIN